jgi:sugar/nucleoside kinase (ribokinase family)
MNMLYDIICAGVACLDIVVSGNVSPNVFEVDSTAVGSILLHSGGDASNQAVTASSLGLHTGLISCVGDDWKGQQLLSLLQAKGVNTDLVETLPDEDSVASIVLVGDDGSRNFMFDRGCGEKYLPSPTIMNAVKSTKLLSIGSFFVLPRFDHEGVQVLLEIAKEAGVITVADMTCDTLKEGFSYIGNYLSLIDYLMPSYEEAREITGLVEPNMICQRFREYGVHNIVIKMGAKGCYISTPEGDRMIDALKGTKVIDTTGCGDTFVAAFCYGLLNGKTVDESAIFAHGAAAINASHLGASGHIRSAQEVESLITRTIIT